MIEENNPHDKGTLFCNQCKREHSSEWFCKNCYGSATVAVFDRFYNTATNDEMLFRVKQLEDRLENIENMLKEIKINLIPIKTKLGGWAEVEL